MFYGEFYRGLLDGQGTMSFENGDCYVGDVKDGMMKGTGHFTKRGISTYRYYEAELTLQQFKQIRNYSSLDDIPELQNIFHPLVSFYRKLQEIYQHRRGNISSRKDSYVEIALDNDNQDEEINGSEDMERMSSKSSNSMRASGSQKLDLLNELIRTNSGKVSDIVDKGKQKEQQPEKEKYKEKETVKLPLKKQETEEEEFKQTNEAQAFKPRPGFNKTAPLGGGRGALNDY